MVEKRKHARLKVSKPVEFTTRGRIHYGVIADESKGGMFIETGGKLLVGDTIKMIYIGSSSIQITRNAKIIRIKPGGIIVQFDNSKHAKGG